MRISVLIVDDAILSPEQEAALLAELPAARRTTVAAQPDTRTRQRSLLGTKLLRIALSNAGARRDTFGSLRHPAAAKPRLDPPWEFSLAHCEGLVVCALSADGPVGIDVEPLGTLMAGTSDLYLSNAERALAGDDPARFYALWTRKEAVAKAAGLRGLRDLRAVAIEGERATAADRTWHTASLDVGPGFVAHLASLCPAPIVDLRRLARETLR